MLVYRVCSEKEVGIIFEEHSICNIGKEFTSFPTIRSHVYQSGRKYIHFFKNYKDIYRLDIAETPCICTYNIPDELLEQYKGTGNYMTLVFPYKWETVEEYAIPSDLVDYEFLNKVDVVDAETEDEYGDILPDPIVKSTFTMYERERPKQIRVLQGLG